MTFLSLATGRAFTYDVSQAFENTSAVTDIDTKMIEKDIPAVDAELLFEKTDMSTFKPMDTSL